MSPISSGTRPVAILCPNHLFHRPMALLTFETQSTSERRVIELHHFEKILGESPATLEVRHFGRRAAEVDAPVLLTGESGTGKGLLARAIHLSSNRADRPFITINCAGIPESLFESEFFGHTRGAFTGAAHPRKGLFEQADGGSLFLDEIGELAVGLQAKLLTALEDGQIRRLGAEGVTRVDTRIIAATGVDLAEAVHARHFRRDLYHRLLVLSCELPPLREREGDIRFLADHFLSRSRERYSREIEGFEPDTLRILEEYPWPGNIRELAHTIEAAVLLTDHQRIRVEDLPRNITDDSALSHDRASTYERVSPANGIAREENGLVDPERDFYSRSGGRDPLERERRRYSFYGRPEEERAMIAEIMRRYHGNRTRAARALGMARNTLRQKLRTLELEEPVQS